MNKIKIYPTVYHFYYWIYYVSYSMLFYYVNNYTFYLVSTILFFFSLIVIFYSVYFSTYLFLTKRQFVFPIVLIAFSYFFASYISKWLLENTHLYAPNIPDEKNVPLLEMFLTYFPQFIENTFWGVVFCIATELKKTNENRLKIIVDKNNLAYKNLVLNLNLETINNDFDNILNLPIKYISSIKDDLMELKNLFNYYVNNSYTNFIDLKTEVENTKNFIKFTQKRHDNQFKIQYNFQGEFDDFIVPCISIMSLVENAFKHGDLINEPLIFKISGSKKRVEITIANKISQQYLSSTKVGLVNLKRRLDILLPNKYILENKKTSDNYFISNLVFYK